MKWYSTTLCVISRLAITTGRVKNYAEDFRVKIYRYVINKSSVVDNKLHRKNLICGESAAVLNLVAQKEIWKIAGVFLQPSTKIV